MLGKNNDTLDISLNGGVMIIGSLLWDTDKIRVRWQDNYLEMQRKLHVAAPIRYGRISSERKCTFTMVFSAECLQEKMKGCAVFVPFSNNPVSMDNLNVQARELIKSERKTENLTDKNYNWGWGTLALAINPALLEEKSLKNKEIELLKRVWATNYSNGFNPENYKIGSEVPIVNKQGILSYNWPKELTDFDFILVTCTKTERESYPSPKNIAERMLVNEYTDYFNKNRELGITTFQDKEVADLLEGKKHLNG